MDRSQQNFHNMVRTVLRTRIDHAAAVSSPPALVRVFNKVAELEALLNAARQALEGNEGAETVVKNLLKTQMAGAVAVVLGMVEAHASMGGNTKLALEAHVVPSDFLGRGDLDAANFAVLKLGLVAPGNVAVLQSDFGLTNDALGEAQGLTNQFSAAVGAARGVVGQNAGQESLVDWTIGQLRMVLDTQMDPLARQFDLQPKDSGSISKKLWFDAYTSGRVIVDLAPGSGGADTGGNGGGPVVPPSA